ncbi:MAG: hypothetical protein O3C21_15710 [Verrucomicrobia bacterium]|nr:hypothetical protein [Verrucomicrobiota bacterium]
MRLLILERRPWEKSTGPRSVEGKAKASRNAYRGALRPAARDLVRQIGRCESLIKSIR